MKFPVDLLADVSQTELEHLAHNCMNNLLYSNPDSPECLTLSDSTQVTIDISSVGFVPLYGSSDKQKILALFSPSDPFTAVALYLLDQWWAVDDILKTADPARHGAVEVETVGERIVLYILNRVIYRAKEMSSDELPFLCHGEKDHAKILWNNGEAVGFYSVKPSGSLCNSFSTRSYQLPVMDSIFVRKCQRGKGFGLQMLEDFVLSFKEDCLGLRYPLSPSMYKVCEKYLCQYPGDTGLLWEVEGIGGPNQRTNIASRIQAMEQSAVSKNLSFTEESLVITQMTGKGVAMEAVTTQIKDAESVECTVEIVEEVTVLSATIVPLTARGRSSGSKRRKTGEKIAEDKPEKVLRIEDIEAETPRGEQVSAQQETELHNVSELVQTEGMISVAPEGQGEDAVDTVPEETVRVLDQPATVLAPQDLEEADVTLAPVTEEPQVENDTPQDLTNTSHGSQITVENVASEIEEAEKEYQKEDTAVLVVSEEVLEVHKGAETLDKVGEKTQIGDTGEKLEKKVTQHEVSLLTYATSEDGEAGRTGKTRRTVVKAIKTVQSETPRRRSKRQHKLQEGLKEESTVQGGDLILRGRTVTKTPTPKRKNPCCSQKVSEELEKEANEVADENEVSTTDVVEESAVIEREQEEMTSVKRDVVDVEELTEEKQQLKDEQLANEGEAKKQHQPGVEDTVVKGCSTELPNIAETALTKENEDEKVTDESQKIQKGKKVETSVIGDKQDVSDDEIQEPPVAQKRALTGRLKVTPKPQPTRQSKRHQKQKAEHTDEADLETGGYAGEEKADEQPTEKQMDEHHKDEQEETADKTEKDISIEETTVLKKSRIPQTEKTAEDVIPSTEVNVEGTKEVQEMEETEGEAEKEKESVSVFRKGGCSAAATARLKIAHTQCQTEEEGEEETEETEREEEETGQELSEEKGEGVGEEEKSVEMEKDKDVEDEIERVAGEESAIGDTEQMKDVSAEEAAVLEEEDNSVKAVDEISTHTVQISPAEVEERNSAKERQTTVLEIPTGATEVGSDTAITEEEELVGDASVVPEEEAPAITTRAHRSKIKTSPTTPSRSKRQKDQGVVETQQQEEENPEEEQDHEVTNASPPRFVRQRPRVDSSVKGEVDEQGETEAATDKEESDDDEDNKEAKFSADEPKEKLDNLDIDNEVETTGISQKDEDNEQNMSEEEVEPIVIGKRVLRGRSLPSVTVTPQPKSRRCRARAPKAEESLSDEEMSTKLAQAEENAQPDVEMEKLEAVAQESVTEQEAVKEEQSAVSETCAEGQEVASVGESSEKTPNSDKGMVTDKAEAPPVETVVRRSGEKTVRTTRSKTTKRQDDEQKQSAVKKSTEEGELAVETRFFRRGRRSAAATAKHKSKRACQTEEEGEESHPAEETGREEGETWQKLPEEKREEVEEEEESVEMEKDKDVEDEVESTAGGEFAVGDAEQMKDASTEEAAVLEEEDNSDKDVDEISTDTVQISPAEVGETNSAEEEETTVLEKPTVAPDVGSDTAIVTGVAGDVIQEPDTVAATLEAVIPDIVLGEADASAAGEPQEKDIGSEIPKLQKATIILVDIKTTCHHLSVKEAEETPVARVHAASGKQQEEENGDKQENIKEKPVEATVETETSKKEELEEDNTEKEKDESADVRKYAEEALVTEKQTVESSCESTSRSDQQKEEDNTGEGLTKNELDEVETGTDEVEEEMESVDKDAVIVIVPVEKKQSAVSEICREADIPAGDDAEGNLPPAEVDKAMSSEEEEEASVVETRALKRQTKPSKATPKRKSTRRRKQGDAQEEDNNNREEQLAVTTRTLRSGRISASDTQKGKSRRSCKQIQEGGQNVEEKTQSVNKTRVEEDEAVEPAIEKTDKEMEDKDKIVEKFKEEAATERVEDLEPEIDMEDGKAVTMQAQDGVEEQLESIFKTFAEKEVEASGEECDERKPAMGREEMELLPDAVTRSLRSGQKMSKASPKNKSRQSKKQQDEMKEGGVSAEKSTDGNEPPAETRILRGGRKSVCGIHKQLKKEEDGLKESGEEAGVVEEEEARLGSVKEPPTEADEGKVPEEDKTEMENEEFVPVEVRKGVSEEGTMEITEDEENTAGDAADADELVQGETDTQLPELATDSAVLSPSKEEATHSAEDQQSEEMAPKLSDLQRLTVVLVDVQKKHHDIKEVTAAARLGGSVQKTATTAEEEQKEEGAAEEKVTGFPLGTEKNELEKVIVEEEEFQDDVEAVTTKDTGEGIAEETAKEEEAKSINDEQEPIITETKTCRSKKQAVKATPSTKLARSGQKKGELAKEASTIQKVQTVQTVQIRVLRRGRMFRPVTQKCATKRTHKQLQEREEVEGGEKSTAVKDRVEEQKQQQVIDQEKKEKLKERDVTEQVEQIEAEMGMDKENTLAEEAVIQQEEEQLNSTETAGNEETGASAGQHADEGKAPDVAEEAVPTQDTVEGEQLTSASKEVESAAGVSTQETLLTAKDDKANNVSEKEEATVTERVLRSGEKTVRDTRRKTTKRQKDEQEETAVEKSTEEDELTVETRILRKGRRSAAATARQKSKRACTQCQTEEEGEEETPPAEETGGEEGETRQGSPEEKGEEVEEEERGVELEKDKDVEDEEVESAAGEEFAIGDAAQMKDASTEEVAVLEEEDKSDKDVDDMNTHTVQISSAEEEETTVIEKVTDATEVRSDTALTEEEEIVGDASEVPEEEAPATTRAPRSKIKTSPATPSQRCKKLKDQGVVETQQQEEEDPEEEQNYEVTNDSPPRSVQKRPRVDSSEKGEADERSETEAATEKEESDDDKDNKKAKSSADEPKEKLDNLYTDREVKTVGISQKDEDNEQDMSEEEVEPIMIGKRVLRGRTVAAVIITPQPKSRRRSAKAQTAEESLSDEEKNIQLAQTEENTELEVEMEKVDAVVQESVTEQETVEEEQSAVSETCAEGQEVASVGESSEKTPNADKGMVTDKAEALPVETVVRRSGEKTVRTTRSKTAKRQDDEQEESAVEKSTEGLAVETRILRKGRRSAAATARQKSKRACTQCQTEEEGEEETPPAEETGGEEGETRQGSPEEKGEEVEEEERGVEMEKDKDVEDEVERAFGGESAVGDAKQMKDASAEEAAVLEEEDNSVKAVDDISTHTVQISPAEVGETNSAEEEETTVLEKPTAATEVGSDTAITEEEELVGDASVVPEEEAPAITTRVLRSKIKTSPATPSRSKRQKDQEVVETQQQEEDPEEEQDHEVTNDSPPRSVRKRPRVDSSEKGEVNEQRETEATTDKEESDDDKDNKKVKSSADEPKEKLDNLDRHREVETAGISQKDEDNEQNISKEEVEPIVIGKRVLRGRSVSSVTVTPQPKSRRRSAKVQKAEESLSDEEKTTQLAQAEENTQPEVEMEKLEAVAQESVTEQETVKEEQSAVSETCAEGQELVSVGERAEETPNADKGMVTDEEEAPTVVTGVLRSGEKIVRITRSKTRKGQDDEQEESAVEKSTEEDELAVETRILRKGERSAAATARQKSKRARTQCQTEEEGEEETPPAEETGGEEEETRQGLPEEKGEEVEEEEKSVDMQKDKDEENEEVESAAGKEFAIGDAEQMKDASTEEAAVLEEEDKSDKDIDDISTHTVQISSAEVEETNSSEEEETTVIEKVTDAAEVGSDTALTEEEELVGSASVVPEEATAITTRGLRSKIKTSSATSSRRSKRQKDQKVVETQQQEEDPEEEQDHEVTNDSPPKSVRKRPRVDSSEKGEADEQRETEAATEEQSDDNKDNKKAKSYADEPKEKLDNLDRDREVETAGISQKDVDNEQNMSKEELEPIVIGKRVLRGRSVSSVIVTPQPKCRRYSAKVQTAEESLSDEEENARFAQKRKSTEVTATRKSKRLSRD
ncbi:uncharacterized protein LOC117253156 isoform X3 [Epinephelus lanceolatus]